MSSSEEADSLMMGRLRSWNGQQTGSQMPTPSSSGTPRSSYTVPTPRSSKPFHRGRTLSEFSTQSTEDGLDLDPAELIESLGSPTMGRSRTLTLTSKMSSSEEADSLMMGRLRSWNGQQTGSQMPTPSSSGTPRSSYTVPTPRSSKPFHRGRTLSEFSTQSTEDRFGVDQAELIESLGPPAMGRRRTDGMASRKSARNVPGPAMTRTSTVDMFDKEEHDLPLIEPRTAMVGSSFEAAAEAFLNYVSEPPASRSGLRDAVVCKASSDAVVRKASDAMVGKASDAVVRKALEMDRTQSQGSERSRPTPGTRLVASLCSGNNVLRERTDRLGGSILNLYGAPNAAVGAQSAATPKGRNVHIVPLFE